MTPALVLGAEGVEIAKEFSSDDSSGFINGIMDALNINKNVTLVMHDWGGPLGLTWARSNSQYIKGLVHCEIVVGNHSSYDEYPDSHGERLKRVRGQDGEELVMTDNYFIEKIFNGGVIRKIDE